MRTLRNLALVGLMVAATAAAAATFDRVRAANISDNMSNVLADFSSDASRVLDRRHRLARLSSSLSDDMAYLSSDIRSGKRFQRLKSTYQGLNPKFRQLKLTFENTPRARNNRGLTRKAQKLTQMKQRLDQQFRSNGGGGGNHGFRSDCTVLLEIFFGQNHSEFRNIANARSEQQARQQAVQMGMQQCNQARAGMPAWMFATCKVHQAKCQTRRVR